MEEMNLLMLRSHCGLMKEIIEKDRKGTDSISKAISDLEGAVMEELRSEVWRRYLNSIKGAKEAESR